MKRHAVETVTYPVAGPSGSNYTIIRAVRTGEFRPPLKGEWYISGAIPEAYQAPNDLRDAHAIAKLYRVKKVIYWELGEEIS